MAVWDDVLSDRDKAVYEAAGFGKKRNQGQRPAALIVDVSQAFTGEKPEPILESIKKWRDSCGEEGWRGVHAIQQLLSAARAKGTPVLYSQQVHSRLNESLPTGMDPRADGEVTRWIKENPRTGGQEGVDGFDRGDIVREIAPQPQDVVIRKEQPSAFFGTPLASYLLRMGVDSLIVGGTTTSGCVRATVVDAVSCGFKVMLVEECCFDRGEVPHKISLVDINAKYADVVSPAEAQTYLAGLPDGLYRADRPTSERAVPAAP